MASSKKQMKKPVWLKYTEAEIKEIILKIAEKSPDMTAEKIGLILRDNYGVPSARIYGIKISKVLKEANKYKSPDQENLKNKANKIEKHIAKNKHDARTGRAFIITKAKLKKVTDYLTKKK